MGRLSARGFRVLAAVSTLTAVSCAALASSGSPASATSTWSVAQAPTPTPVGGWSTVGYLHGRWIALSHTGESAVSSDGAVWTEQPIPVGSWQSMAYGAGRYVALSSDSGVPSEMVSPNGLKWSLVHGPPGTPHLWGKADQYGQWSGLAYADGEFAAVSSVGTIATSADGLSWKVHFFRPADQFTAITYGGGRFVVVDGAHGDVVVSLDGRVWGLVHQPLAVPVAAPAGGLHLSAVTYGHGNFVAFGGSGSGAGYFETSVYGENWTLHQYAPAESIAGVAFGCDAFVAAGQSTSSTDPVLSSSSGMTWTPAVVATATVSSWTSVGYGAGRYVAVDAAGDIAWSPTDAKCAQTVPSAPQQVSGNVHSGEVWTYMHPPASSGAAPVEGYRVAITDGVTTKYCGAPVYYEPNCIIRGLSNHKVYWVTAQAFNRFGYSAPSDAEFVIPVPVWNLDTASAPVIASGTPAELQLTGVIANAAGFYPVTTVWVHFGAHVITCRPSPFGECIFKVAHPPTGVVPIYATYTGYGRSYRSPTHVVKFASVSVSSTTVPASVPITVTVRGGVSGSTALATVGSVSARARLDRAGFGSFQVLPPSTPGTYTLNVNDRGVALVRVQVTVSG